MTRRTLLLLALALLLGLDFGLSQWGGHVTAPPGWKTARWEAGFGSWNNGGYGVAYTIAMPRSWHFQQKCGRAWISAEDAPGDFSLRFAFAPQPGAIMADVNDYLATDARQAPASWGATQADLTTGKPTEIWIGGASFARTDLTLNNANLAGEDTPSAQRGTIRAAIVTGHKISVILDFDRPERFATSERIMQTLRPAHGIGIIDLLLGMTMLFGC